MAIEEATKEQEGWKRNQSKDPFEDQTNAAESEALLAAPPYEPSIHSRSDGSIHHTASPSVYHETTNPFPLNPTPISPSGPSQEPPQNIHAADALAAIEHAAQSLEMAAANHPDPAARKILLRKAKKLRRKKQFRFLDIGNKEAGIGKTIGAGAVLLCTTPFYISGAAIEGTGIMLKSSGMVLKAIGGGLKKVHTWTIEKLDL